MWFSLTCEQNETKDRFSHNVFMVKLFVGFVYANFGKRRIEPSFKNLVITPANQKKP